MTRYLVLASLVALGAYACDDDDDDAPEGGGGEDGGIAAAGGAGGAVDDASPAELAACIGLGAGEACTVENGDGSTTEGVCGEAANGLACRDGAPMPAGGMGGMMGGEGGMMSPPPAAFEACEGAEAGAACSFETPRGATDGDCQDTMDGLVCVPEGGVGGMGGMMGGMGGMMGGMGGMMGGEGGMMGPPQVAIEACAELMEGADCSFPSRDGDRQIEGTCTQGEDGLVCTRDGMGGMGGMMGGMGGAGGAPPEGGEGGAGGMMMGPPQAALDACVGLMADDPCAFEDGGNMIEGTCFDGPNGLSCRPERMPEGGEGGAGGAMMPPDGGEGGAGGAMMPPDGGEGGAGGAMMPPDGGDGGAGGEMMAPAEATAACENLAEGDACMFTAPNGRDIEGTCRRLPDGQVACVPAMRM